MDTKPIRTGVAPRIKELRAAHGVTQETFALMVGLNRSYLAGIEKGNRNFGIDTLDKNIKDMAHLVCRGGWPRAVTLEDDVSLGIARDYLAAPCGEDIVEVDGVVRNPQHVDASSRNMPDAPQPWQASTAFG